MTPAELRGRLAAGENLHTEFKRELGSVEELCKDLICLANTDGGQLLVGVCDDGDVVGVDDTEAVFRSVDDAAFARCEPPLTVVQETVALPEATVVVVNVPKGDQRPYRTKSGRFYVRTAHGCRQASRQELLRLFQAVGSVTYDQTPLHALTIDDIDIAAAERYIADQDLGDVDTLRTLRAWGLVHNGHPTVAGVLLFGRRPQESLTAAGLVLLAYEGTDAGDDIVDRADARGGLIDVVDQAETFLGLHLRSGRRIRGFEPEAVDEMPGGALREAVVNALVHRDYTIGGPTRVIVFADRVEIHAPGRPPNSVDEESMRAGVHVPRNPHVYSRVVAAGLATRAGSGVPRIARSLRDSGGRRLGIRVSDAETVLTLPRLGDDHGTGGAQA